MVKEDFFWIGGALWLDFINTENKATGQRADQLADKAALCEWLQLSGSVPAGVIQEVASWSETRLEELLIEARALRRALRSLCEEFEGSGVVSPPLAEQINPFLEPSALGYRLELSVEGNFDLHSHWGNPTPRQLLFPIAMAAAQTLSHGDLTRLHKCANPNCILWFLDTSKNGKRRWCSMDICGNRHKVSQHHLRKKG